MFQVHEYPSEVQCLPVCPAFNGHPYTPSLHEYPLPDTEHTEPQARCVFLICGLQTQLLPFNKGYQLTLKWGVRRYYKCVSWQIFTHTKTIKHDHLSFAVFCEFIIYMYNI